MRLLCLSNGHGEDAIAVKILQELQQQSDSLELAALPLVGEGLAYTNLDIPLIGSVQRLPSGGFIYMDGRQLMRDVKGGLLQLTFRQIKAIRKWAKKGGAILAVGDIVPLLYAWLSGLPYAFVGTAKSEYYLRDEAGALPRQSRSQRREGWSGSVYLPWERWLMSRRRCVAVFPRDTLTTETLKKWPIPAFNLGNPMMDGIQFSNSLPNFDDPENDLKEQKRALIITLIPGSRPPEAYENWQKMMPACKGLIEIFHSRSLVFLGAIAPGLNLDNLKEILETQGWILGNKEDKDNLPTLISTWQLSLLEDSDTLFFTQKQAVLILTQQGFKECLNEADFAIAMAGTATEQFVGLGKPAIAIPGNGPQFTPAFAEAQSRLLGPSLILIDEPSKVADIVRSLLRDPDRLQIIGENGRRRMGEPGAANRIAACLINKLG